jgi:CHRD domain
MRRILIAIAVALPVLFVGIVATAEGRETSRTASPGVLTICHKTGSEANPWRRITVSTRAVLRNPRSRSARLFRAHMRHVGDAVVIGSAPCPDASQTATPTGTAPTRVTICHKTGSTANPYRRITVSSRAVTNPRSPAGQTLRGHMGHTGDILLPGNTPCPSGTANQPVRLRASLQPVTGATGSGTATFSFRVGPSVLCHTLTVTGLTNVTAAHIHRFEGGAIVVPLTTPTTGTSSGCATIDRTLLQEIVRTPAAFYVNVHTIANPDGQVQGRLSR